MSIKSALYNMSAELALHASKVQFDSFLQDLSTNFESFLTPCSYYAERIDLVRQRIQLDKEYFALLSTPDLVSSPGSTHENLLPIIDTGYIRSDSLLTLAELNSLRAIAKHSYLFSRSHWNVAAYGGYSESRCQTYFNLFSLDEAPYWIVDPSHTNSLINVVQGLLSRRGLLPPPPFRIDNLNFFHINNNPNIGGVYWHKDAAGHAIRFFITLHSTGVSPSTSVIPGTHLFPSYGILLDFIRGLYADESYLANRGLTSLQLDKLVEDLIVRFVGSHPISLNQITGSISAWDFNTFHRATQPAVHSLMLGQGSRTVLMVDYMPKSASDFIVSRNLAPCAPGQVPILFNDPPSSPYIDTSCLHSLETGYLYSHPSNLHRSVPQIAK